MGILGALFSGVSGIDVYSQSIEVIGNNIANANTPGFKGSRAEFVNILARALSGAGGGNQIGRGVQLANVESQFTQGSFETTSSGTDLAIDGRGFFIVRNADGVFYTRAGLFTIDASGFLETARNDRVQGVTLDAAGNPSGTLGDLNLTVTNNPPQKTSKASFVANLDATANAIGSAGTAKSAAAVTDRFQFLTGVNDQIFWNDGVADRTASLTTNGLLGSGNFNTATAVATAIKTALEATDAGGAAANVYAVSYSATTRKFTVTNNTGNFATIILKHTNAASTASDDLGFSTAADDTVAVAASAVSDNQVQFNVVTGRNTFTITLDGGFYGVTNKTVTVAAGGYTGDQLAQAVEAGINSADAADTVNRIRAVRVTYNAAGNTNQFQISSQTTGEARTINIASNSTSFTIPASSVVVDEAATGGVLEIMDMSLNGTADAVLANGVGKFSETDPSNLSSSNFSTSIIMFDSLGSPHSLNIFFRKIGENIWEYNGLMLGSEVVGPTGNTTNEQVLYGRLWFNEDGSLDVEDKFNGATTLDNLTFATANVFNFSGGATQGQVIDFDFGTARTTDADPNAGLNGVTQFAGTSAVINQIQDGFTTGTLVSITINRNGNITGQFTNGQTRDLARIVLANFNAPGGLNNTGNSLFAETQDSGQPILGQATTAGFGNVLSNSVEISNVDIAEEFVRLIRDQQAFQANARVISTTEDLLDEVVNLTR